MVASESFAEFLREQLAPLGRVTMRRMFGKTGVFCDGLMLGMVTDDTLYFRVDDHNRAAFKKAESFPPLNYEKTLRWREVDSNPWSPLRTALFRDHPGSRRLRNRPGSQNRVLTITRAGFTVRRAGLASNAGRPIHVLDQIL